MTSPLSRQAAEPRDRRVPFWFGTSDHGVMVVTFLFTLSSWREWHMWFEQTGRNIFKLFYSIEICDSKGMIFQKPSRPREMISILDHIVLLGSLYDFLYPGLYPWCRRRIRAVSSFLCIRLLHAHRLLHAQSGCISSMPKGSGAPLNWLWKSITKSRPWSPFAF